MLATVPPRTLPPFGEFIASSEAVGAQASAVLAAANARAARDGLP